MNAATKGLVAVAAVAGAFFRRAGLGQVADRIGRKRHVHGRHHPLVIFSAASARGVEPGVADRLPLLPRSWHWSGLSHRRLLHCESVPTRLRGRLIVGAFAFQALGSLLGVLIGLLILKGRSHAAGVALYACFLECCPRWWS